MSIPAVLKACSETYVRLFDHRPIMTSEINYTLHELETKRSDRELRNCRRMVTQCAESVEAIDAAERTLVGDVATLFQSIDRCTKACDVIAGQESDEPIPEPLLTDKARRRSERWQAFLLEQQERARVVDERFEEEKLKLEKTYTELEHKLCSSL